VEKFSGVTALQGRGKQCGMTVLFGAEISLEEGPEDYLLYGFPRDFF
jgi:hypothetical protein